LNSDWLSAQSFEQTHRILTALNRVSIDTKLALAGRTITKGSTGRDGAREALSEFLDAFEGVVQGVRENETRFVRGVNPRLESLAQRYISETRQRPRRSALAGTNPGEILRLLGSAARSDQERLIACLRELRMLLEQHAHADVGALFGEI